MSVSPLERRLINQIKISRETLQSVSRKIDFLIQRKYKLQEKMSEMQKDVELLGRERIAKEKLRTRPEELLSVEQLVLAKFGREGLAALEEMRLEGREGKEVRV